jgi:hypothetical protein
MPELTRGLDPQVAVYDLAIAAREHRNFEAEFANAGTHAIDDCVVFSWISRVQNQAINRPDLDFKTRSSGHAPSLPASDFIRQQ